MPATDGDLEEPRESGRQRAAAAAAPRPKTEGGGGKAKGRGGGKRSKPLSSSPDDALAVVVDLGDAEHELALRREAITSRAVLKRQVVSACIDQLGRGRTPLQWLSKRDPPAMTILLIFDNQIDPPSQVALTDRTPIAKVCSATSVHVMPT